MTFEFFSKPPFFFLITKREPCLGDCAFFCSSDTTVEAAIWYLKPCCWPKCKTLACKNKLNHLAEWNRPYAYLRLLLRDWRARNLLWENILALSRCTYIIKLLRNVVFLSWQKEMVMTYKHHQLTNEVQIKLCIKLNYYFCSLK